MAAAASSLSPRVSVATSVFKEQPLATVNALPRYFTSAPGPLKRGSRRRPAVAGAIDDGSQLHDTTKPGFAQIVQRSPISPQTQELGVALRETFSSKRRRLDEIVPSTTVPSALGSASAGFLVNPSPRSKIIHTYSRKNTCAHRTVIAWNDSGTSGAEGEDARYTTDKRPQRSLASLGKRKSDTRVDEVPNTKKVLAAGKLTTVKGKRKRRAPVGELALVRSATDVEAPSSQVEVLSRPNHFSEDLIENSPNAVPTKLGVTKLLPSGTPSTSSRGQKPLSVIRKTIKLPQGPHPELSIHGFKHKQIPATPRSWALQVGRLGSGFEGLENVLPPKEPPWGARRYRTGNKVLAEVSLLDFAEVTRERQARGVPRPAQPVNKRSEAFTSATSFDMNLSGRGKTERRLIHSIENDSTNMQPYNSSRYTAVSNHAEDPVHVPPVYPQSRTNTAFIRPIIALHRNLQSSGYLKDSSAGKIDNQPRHQASHIRRRVTFEDEIWPQPLRRSSPPAQTSTIANAHREVEADDEELPGHLSNQPRKSDELDTEDTEETDDEDLINITAIVSRHRQAFQLKNLRIATDTAFSKEQSVMGINAKPRLHEKSSLTTSPMTSNATPNAIFERRASSGSGIKNSDSLGTRPLASSSKGTTVRESQLMVPDTDSRLSKLADDIVDDHSPIISAENHRAIRRGSLILSLALQSSPPPSSDPPSPCRLRAKTLGGAIRRRSEIPDTQKLYELPASYLTPKGPLRSILKKGSNFVPSATLCVDSEEEEEEAVPEDNTDLDQPIPEASLTTTKYFSQAVQQLNSPATRPDKIVPRVSRTSPLRLYASHVDEEGEEEEEEEEPVLSMTRRIKITPNTSRRRSALVSGGSSSQDLGSLTRRMSEELRTTPELKRRLSYLPFVPPFKNM